MMQTILVVGGAGYIGSHMCKHLAAHGYRPLVLDNLIYGHREAVRWGPFLRGDLGDAALLDHLFEQYDIAVVMHFAAYCYVGESVTKPADYYANNVAATLTLLERMVAHGVRRFIFSSTCATYGDPVTVPIPETHPQQPINPYGHSKQMVEQILRDFEFAYGLKSISLRYFNAAGADPEGEIGEDHRPETHLIPIVLQTALGQRENVSLFGDDYATPDGTCIRDYIHVEDLAQAHLLAMRHLLNDGSGGAYNLGNGQGYSVREVIDSARKITGKTIPVAVTTRRQGDPAVLVGSSETAKATLGWCPRYIELEAILDTAWQWHRRHPLGYDEV